jgi:hypothetical protein
MYSFLSSLIFVCIHESPLLLHTIQEFSIKCVKVMLPYNVVEGCLYWGWGQCDDSYCWLCNHTTQSIAFKYVMASGPPELKQVMAGFSYIKGTVRPDWI